MRVTPHYSPVFFARTSRRNVQWSFRPEGRGGVLYGTLSTPMGESAAERCRSQAAVEFW